MPVVRAGIEEGFTDLGAKGYYRRGHNSVTEAPFQISEDLPQQSIPLKQQIDAVYLQNYTQAMNDAIAALERLPLSMRLIERNKGAYYDALTRVRTSNDIEHWIKFFLAGVSETATNSRLTFEKIIELRQRSEQQLMELGKRAKVGQQLLHQLFSQPILNAKQIAERLQMTYQSASTLAKSFEEIGILEEITGYKRNRLFVFSEYLNLLTHTPPSRKRKPKSAP